MAACLPVQVWTHPKIVSLQVPNALRHGLADPVHFGELYFPRLDSGETSVSWMRVYHKLQASARFMNITDCLPLQWVDNTPS